MAAKRLRFRSGAALVAALGSLLVLTGCTSSTIDPTRTYEPVDAALGDDVAAGLQGVLDQAVALSGSSGGVAAAWAPWSGEWTAAAGTVSFDEGAAPVTPETRFPMTTATSELTCLVLLRLADAGVIALDDPVSERVRGIPGLDGITLEQLCRHTSGLADYYPTLRTFFVGNPTRLWPANELIASGIAVQRVGAPGEAVSYSRTGVLLLTRALEQTTGESWSALVERYVLEPLELDATTLPPLDRTEHPGILGGYALAAGGDPATCVGRTDVSARSVSPGGTAAGAVTDLDDLTRFSLAFANGALLAEETARAQWATIPLGGDAPAWTSQGIGGTEYGPLRGTAGETPGALTAAYSDPTSGLTVVVSLNNSTAGPEFVQQAAFALASVASKAPATGEGEQPLIELPWSLEQKTARMQELAVCQTPPPAA